MNQDGAMLLKHEMFQRGISKLLIPGGRVASGEYGAELHGPACRIENAGHVPDANESK